MLLGNAENLETWNDGYQEKTEELIVVRIIMDKKQFVFFFKCFVGRVTIYPNLLRTVLVCADCPG